ncbi:peptidase C65 Otubain family protein, partial [Chlamydia psittaci 84-8471/1]
TDGYGD